MFFFIWYFHEFASWNEKQSRAQRHQSGHQQLSAAMVMTGILTLAAFHCTQPQPPTKKQFMFFLVRSLTAGAHMKLRDRLKYAQFLFLEMFLLLLKIAYFFAYCLVSGE